MKKNTSYHWSILWQSLQGASILSLFVYAVPRILFYDFPMNWMDEISYFIRIYGCSLFVLATATAGPALLYRSILRMRLHRK